MTPADVLTTLPLGTRVVVRYRVEGGFTDALGPLRACDPDECVVDTSRGPSTIALSSVVAAKQVPPAPARRVRPH
ncbi:putative acetyltransferase [Amycolatopsis sp. H20-H5]|uniref:putative acetyltransferase n=1 Tax=Amycolatopsis sp. H20-H5 TaxID=3046309 RepID=UPI002DBB7770|nr:ferrous iron transport protein A [Amycolatopsis sp. H20-H5]MEC3981717.1 ferrous iron transport protein A [Amycolatopsis sp. H20-H5]